MHLFGLAATILFAGPSSSNTDRWINALTDAKDISIEAADMAKAERHQEAVQLFEDAMLFGRKAALGLHESGADEGGDALEWLIALYRDSASSRLRIEDVAGARKDAWRACVFSQNTDIPSLECLAEVCEASDDDIGHVQALKRIIELDSGTDTDINAKRTKKLQSTIDALEEKIKSRFSS